MSRLDSFLDDIYLKHSEWRWFAMSLAIPGLMGLAVVVHELLSGYWRGALIASLLALSYIPIYVIWRGYRSYGRRMQQVRLNTRSMLDSADDLIIQHTMDGHILGANLSASRKLGYRRTELPTLTFSDLDEDRVLKNSPSLQEQLRCGEQITYQSKFRARNGDTFPVEIRTRMADWLDTPRLVSIVRDISEWRNTERALEESRKALERARNRLETRVSQRARELKRQISVRQQAEKDVNKMRAFLYAMIDSMPSVIIALDLRMIVTQWNHQAEDVTGIPSTIAYGKSLLSLLPEFEPQITAIGASVVQGHFPQSERIEGEVRGKSCIFDVMVYSLRASGSAGVVVRVDDVTEKVQLEDMLLQTEKMLSLGGLAAGMAHEINNPLGAIMQSSQNLRRRTDPEFRRNQLVAGELGLDLARLGQYLERQKIHGFLDTIDEAGKRAAGIVEDMLSFARPSGAQDQRCNLFDVLESTVRLAQSDYSARKKYDFRNISILREYAEDLPPVSGRRSRLQQVFLNLLTNAAQALALVSDGAPTINLRLYREDDLVVAEVSDNGPGMPEQIRRRIFEPFFTTKAEGSGTGLGLSVSYFIITEQMGGMMEVSSLPNQGTRFVVKLPALGGDGKKESEMSPRKQQQYELPLHE